MLDRGTFALRDWKLILPNSVASRTALVNEGREKLSQWNCNYQHIEAAVAR